MISNYSKAYIFIGFCLIWISGPPLSGQSNLTKDNFKFELFKLPGGQLSNHVQCMAQDSLGFLWFGTQNGLIKYDGQNFIAYFNEAQDTNSLASSYVESIHVDKNNVLWVGSYEAGLTRFDTERNEFERFDIKKTGGNSINCMVEDSAGNLWIGTHNGICRYNPKNQTFKRYLDISLDSVSIKAYITNESGNTKQLIFRSLYIDKQGVLWAGAGFTWKPEFGGLFKYNAEEDQFNQVNLKPEDQTSVFNDQVKAIFEDSKDQFWVGTMEQGLHRINRTTNTFKSFPSNLKKEGLSRPRVINDSYGSNYYNQIQFIHEDYQQRLWIGGIGSGLNIYDPNNKQQIHFEWDMKESHGLRTNYIWNIFETKDRAVFILTGGDGGGKTYKVNIKNNLFPFQSLPREKEMHQITADNDGKIWVGTGGGANNLLQFDPTTKALREPFVKHPLIEISDETFSNIYSLNIYEQNKLLLGFSPGALEAFDPVTNKITPLLEGILRTQLSIARIKTIYEDKKGNLWIGTWGDGLFFNKKGTSELMLFKYDEKQATSIGGNHISSIIEDEKGNVWIGGGKESRNSFSPLFLDKFNSGTNSFDHTIERGSIFGHVVNLVQDKKGRFWFSTALEGIRSYDPKTKTLTPFTEKNGLIPTDEIRGLLLDETDNIWMSTEYTLLKFNPITNTFKIFDEQAGIQTKTFESGVAYKTKDGLLYFGGYGGFHYFDPQKIDFQLDAKVPPVYISNLEINSEAIDFETNPILDQPIWITKEIALAHNENSINLGLICLDYQSPDEVLIEYQLENYDLTWQKASVGKQATYNNLAPATYVFNVRGRNSNGVLNKQGQTLRIVVRSPWWQTWWAFLGYILIGGTIIYGFYQFQLKRQVALQEADKLREIDELKTKLYGNITHEFRTPLTLILGNARQIKDNIEVSSVIKTKAKNIEKSGQQLLNLVTQLLDLRKLESKKESLNLMQGDIVPALSSFVDSFESLAISRGIDYQVNLPHPPLMMDFDYDKLQKIVTNLISNAIKFTEDGEKVSVFVQQIDKQLIIQVKDNGVGISKAQLPFIFNRFFRAENAHQTSGTGIGLSLTKELIDLMKGIIVVNSTENVGSEFMVKIPISNQAPIKEQMAYAPWPVEIEETTIKEQVINENDVEGLPIVLIVEDNIDVAKFTASCLEGFYKTYFAENGQIGIDKAYEIIPDLIISDVMMPIKDGFQLCQELKQDEKTSHIPIILLTAKADIADKLVGLERGADAYLAKPFHEKELKIRIQQLIQLRARMKERYAGLTLKQPSTDKSLQIEDEFILKVRAAIEENLDDEQFGVEELSKAIFLSRAQTHRKIKALTGKSTGQFMHTIRLHHGLKLIQTTDRSITAIAFDVGYNDPSYFTRMFTREFGQPPSYFSKKDN